MKHTFLIASLALCIGLIIPITAIAKTPPEVLKPYKAYHAALEAEDREGAATAAYDAWQVAEDMMGDTKTTGDLASNFADLSPRMFREYQGYRKVEKAYERSVDLARFYSEAPGEIEIQRRIDFLGWANSRGLKSRRSKTYGIDALENRITELDLLNSTYEADYLALKTQADLFSNRWSRAEKRAKKAIALYDSVTDGLPSYFRYVVQSYLADAYVGQGKNVDAILTYQALIDVLEAEAGHKNPLSAKAYGQWIRLRDTVLEEESDDPRIDQIRHYVVPAARAEELQPLLRYAPQIPAVFRRGSHSGWVQFQFDLDVEGRVTNPIILDSSTRKLHASAAKALKTWRYSPNAPIDRRKNLKATIRFDLLSSSGRRLKYKTPPPE